MNTNFFVVILFVFLLESCSLFSPIKTEPQTSYQLTRLPQPQIQKSHHSVTLLVMQPGTSAVYHTKKMAYSIKPYQIAFYANNTWAQSPGNMLQPLMVQALQNTEHFHAILTPASPGHYDFILNTEIQQLVQDYTNRVDLLRFTLRAEITNALTHKVIATKEFSVIEPIQHETPYAGVAAANCATEKLLQQLTAFCLRAI